jgi:hypothetical protein
LHDLRGLGEVEAKIHDEITLPDPLHATGSVGHDFGLTGRIGDTFLLLCVVHQRAN